MDRNIWMGAGAGLLVGLVIGYFVGSSRAETPVPAPATPVAAAPVPVWTPGGAQLDQLLFSAQQAVEKNPRDLKAWTDLGNIYFDSHQAQKAVDAYAKALELEPRNPDILTDQGIMFRELKAFEKALACFEKANKINPKHVQSLYNLGIVYAHDLNAPDKAIKIWSRVIEVAPGSQQAALSKQAIEELKTHIAHP